MRPAALMLLAESEALPPLLRAADPDVFDRPTVLPGWSVRDVLAHCSGAMHHVAAGTLHRFAPEENERDVELRRSWPVDDVLEELAAGYRVTADAIDAAGGALDGLGLGEWIHGGDVRLAMGRDDAYVSAGVEYALDLIVERSVQQAIPGVTATVGARRVTLGDGPPVGSVNAGLAPFIRLVAGRAPDSASYELTGVSEQDLLLFT